jgi:hypothetical protein
MAKQTIGLIGAGNVGAALGRRFTHAGHEVLFGVRDPGHIAALVDELQGAAAAAPTEVAHRADVVFLTVPGSVAVDVAAGLGDLRDKILVDCTNPLRWEAGPVWTPPEEGSITAAIAARCPGVRAVKAFNTFGAEFHANPDLAGGRVEVLMASDDDDAKQSVASLANEAGFAAIDAGPLRNAAVLENQAILWIHLALAAGHGRDFVFQMTRRTSA